MTYDLLSFDLDGTLVETASEIAEAANRAIEAHGLERRTDAEITLLIGAGTRELMRRLLDICVAAQPDLAQSIRSDAVMASFDDQYAALTGSSARPYDRCIEALTRLKKAGVSLACVTNKEIRHARAVLEATRLDGFFDLIVGGDSLSWKKPDSRVLQHVGTTLGVALDAMAHVGDSAVDVQAARNAGVRAWVVPYGYNAGRPVQEAGPDRVFDDLLQVAEHVLSGRRAVRLPDR
jgi:phosphoglycolate phosphatase